MQHVYKLLISALLLLLAGCNSMIKEQQQRAMNQQNMIPCPVERPFACGQDNNSVCGIYADGTYFEYSSKCLACTRRVIIGYIPGTCGNLQIKNDAALK